MLRIKVPATTANLGPGFDSFGMALNLYQSVIIEEQADAKELVWSGAEPMADDKNLVKYALDKTLEKYNSSSGYKLTMLPSQIPMQRGLGSSAAAIVCGVFSANYILGGSLSEEDIISLSIEIEGHPDNVVPAITGGLTITAMEGHKPVYVKMPFPTDLKLAAFIPDCPLSTEKSRSVLPDDYSKKDCVHNIARAGMLISALNTGHYDLLKTALGDALHQPYRLPLIEDSDKIIAAIEKTDAYGFFLSGSGPVIMALIDSENKEFASQFNFAEMALNSKWLLRELKADGDGAVKINQ
ncbi:homoserine kinase [Tyzzerella sp. OttesenSCG-928-J15]|nr:homoserine kinase [Tyzzerella sp. OttesenSCG-928-J15]